MTQISVFQKLVSEAKSKIQEISMEKVITKMKNTESFKLVDVREDNEFRLNRAKGAIHLGKGIIERDIETTIPNKDEEIVLYCAGGARSALAAEAVQKMGYKKVFSLIGGFRAWRESGLPEEKE